MDTTSQKLMPSNHSVEGQGECLIRSTPKQLKSLEKLLYKRYPDAEWGTFFRFGYRITDWGVHVSIVDVFNPEQGDLDLNSPLVEFSPSYISRALGSFSQCEFGIGFVHSHPEGCLPKASISDDDMDSYFAREFEIFSDGRPYISLIVSKDQKGLRTFSGRCFYRGRWMPIVNWITSSLDKIRRETSIAKVNPSYLTDNTLKRVDELRGRSASRRLKNSLVGIVGCSGLGTPVTHVLARAGVGGFVLIDPGETKPSNLERNHAFFASDLGDTPCSKVHLLKTFVQKIRPNTNVVALKNDVLDKVALDQLTRCDLVIGCSDSFYARAALGDLATLYQIPVIDLAVQMRADEFGFLHEQVGEFTRYLPGLPCPWCRGRVTAQWIREETATSEDREVAKKAASDAEARGEDGSQYWIGTRNQENTVGYLTSTLGAIGAGYAQHWLTGSGNIPHERFQLDLGLQSLGVISDKRFPLDDCSCTRCIGYADQGLSEATVSQPFHYSCDPIS